MYRVGGTPVQAAGAGGVNQHVIWRRVCLSFEPLQFNSTRSICPPRVSETQSFRGLRVLQHI